LLKDIFFAFPIIPAFVIYGKTTMPIVWYDSRVATKHCLVTLIFLKGANYKQRAGRFRSTVLCTIWADQISYQKSTETSFPAIVAYDVSTGDDCSFILDIFPNISAILAN